MISTVLVANRGEIARRVFRTCRDLGYRTVAVSSEADRDLPFVREADVAVCIGGAAASESYLDPMRVLLAARHAGADAIHPGYGFLAENADFADLVVESGLTWIGPPGSAMRALGDKAAARRVAVQIDVPVVPGYDGADQDEATFLAAADEIGFPVLVKASAGGGGRGMRRVDRREDLPAALESARREAIAGFGDGTLLLERYVDRPRHVEVQILGDAHGNVVWLGERECSVQRRHQKILEEAPSPAVGPELRARLGAAAVKLARTAGYQSAGTVEFLVDQEGRFYLLEMNARLQVEHPVTELVTGFDLVALQLMVAEGKALPFRQEDVPLNGWAIEARLCAEDPNREYQPSTGTLVRFDLGSGAGAGAGAGAGSRVDSGFERGNDVGIFYDSMLAKLIAWGPDRETANRRLQRLVEQAWAPGVVTNLPLLREVLAHPAWRAGDLDTGFLGRHGLPTSPPLNLDRGALAATVLAWWHRRTSFGARPGWRIEGPGTSTDRWRTGSEEIEASWRTVGDDRLEVTVAGRTRDVRVLGRRGDVVDVEVDHVRSSWRVVRRTPGDGPIEDGELVYAHFGDGEAVVQLVPRFPAPSLEAEPGTLAAPTPGKVAKVAVAVGDDVRKGQILVVLEAMKMEHAIVAPADGQVAEVRVAAGDVVAQGALLVRIDEGASGTSTSAAGGAADSDARGRGDR